MTNMNKSEWLMRVENGLSAHFNQEDGTSRPGVMWHIQLKQPTEEYVYKAIVKTLYADNLLPERYLWYSGVHTNHRARFRSVGHWLCVRGS